MVLFNFSGIKCYAREVARVLKPGGFLVLTSPNPCSLIAMRRLKRNELPMVFTLHVREYTYSDIVGIFDCLQLEEWGTAYVFFELCDEMQRQQALTEAFGIVDGQSTQRGDDHLFLFSKREIEDCSGLGQKDRRLRMVRIDEGIDLGAIELSDRS